MKSFDIKTKISFGENALARLKEIKTDKVFIVTDPFVVSSGLIEHIQRPLEFTNVKVTLFSDVVPDPPIDKVIKGVNSALECKADYILAVGGGSALDTAKAIRKFANGIDGGFRRIEIKTFRQ
jgi:alcohol dehydrogenase class IV